MKRAPGDGERGFALVTVLWAAVVLSVVAASVIAMAQTEGRIAHDTEQRAQSAALADAAINLILLDLLQPGRGADHPGRWEWFPPRCRRAEGPGRGAGRDRKDRPQHGATGVLQQMLVGEGLDAAAADALIDKILDWRERGAGKRLNGAKAEDYRAAGYSYGPREGPFATVSELKLVMGMTRALYARLAACLTVYSQTPMVDLTVAPREVLLLLPGMDDDAVTEILDARTPKPPSDDGDADEESTSSLGQVPSVPAGHALTISATVPGYGRNGLTRTAIVRLTGQTTTPLWIYRWD